MFRKVEDVGVVVRERMFFVVARERERERERRERGGD